MVNPIALILASIAVLCVWKWRGSVNRRAYPPGPSAHPLVGNYLQFPKVSPWVTYAKWAKIYGDVISLSAFGNCIVVVNSAKAASAIFDKRGALYSDRPHNVMAQDLCVVLTGNLRLSSRFVSIKNPGIAFLSYTETFQLQRKLFTTGLNSAAMADYRPVQEKESYALLDRLLESPDKYYKHVRRTAGAVILKIAYGMSWHSVVTDDDYFIQLAEAVVTHLRNSLQPDAFLVNLIPALKHIPAWMPFTAFHRFACMVRQLDTNLHELPFRVVKSQILQGVAPLSYTSKLLNASELITDRDPTEMEDLRRCRLILYLTAGADTVRIMLPKLAMVLHPEVQRKAQAEMDAVVGGSRLPTLADKSSLPYLECILSEVLRWYPVSPLGIPHCARRDDVYEGYLIPEGAVVMGNIWHVHNHEVYQDPRKFWPERFDGRFPMIPDPRHFVFGFGRRICPGRHLANESVFIAIACLISAYNFSKALGRDGKEIEPNIGYSPITGALQPFECQITPRSQETVALIKATQNAYGP
ncbi:cytochrome P450 [Gautieria morchelliformis]|nr:cytochrome P450 [Gautieria morchelliformis]